MKTKPISPELHGIIDYAFAGLLLFGPSILKINKKAAKIYKVLALDVAAYSALTDYPAGITPLISYSDHHTIDCVHIAGLAGTTACRDIRKDKTALIFHVSMTLLAIGNVLLTDWNAGQKR